MSSVTITGGTINNTTIGATTPSTGNFTTLHTNHFGETAPGHNIEFDNNWTAAGRTCADLGTVSTANIDGGTADNVTIGGATPAGGTFTTANATTFDTNVLAAGTTLAGTTLAADGTDADISITITPKGTGSVVISKIDANGGTIDDTAIGSTTKTTGKFTGVTADAIAGADNATTLPISIAATGADIATHTISLGVDGNLGVSVAATGNGAGSVGVNTIGVGNNGAAEVVHIGGANALVDITDAHWSITEAGTSTVVTSNATTFDTNVVAAGVTLAGTTLSADGTDADISINVTPKGTGSVVISKVDVNGGTIDGSAINATTIGAATPSSIIGTTLQANTSETFNKSVPTLRIMKNNSGGALATGDVVILDTTDQTGSAATTTTTVADSKVYGVVTTGGADQADIIVAVKGYVASVKVNGTTDIAIGDPLCTYSAAGIAQKGSTSGVGCFAIALQAYAVDDSAGVIKAVIMDLPTTLAIASGGIYSRTFTSASLVAGVLTVTHNLNYKLCEVAVYDNSDKLVIPDEVTLTSTTALTVDLSSYGAIAGTWSVVVNAAGGTATTLYMDVLQAQVFI
jgi:hypothetical protein